MIEAVFLDIGETVVDETRVWGAWADWLGVPRHTFSAVLGARLARGQDGLGVFQEFSPDFDLETAWGTRREDGIPEVWGEESLYPDARPCLQALRDMGLRVGLAGNQTKVAEAILTSLDLPVHVLGCSETWGLEKPSAAFFDRVVREAGCLAERVLYVGDRIANDVIPAQAAGLATAFIRRGPWGHILRDPGAEARCLFTLNGLSELPELVHRHNFAS